jgi:hypothetical protein
LRHLVVVAVTRRRGRGGYLVPYPVAYGHPPTTSPRTPTNRRPTRPVSRCRSSTHPDRAGPVAGLARGGLPARPGLVGAAGAHRARSAPTRSWCWAAALGVCRAQHVRPLRGSGSSPPSSSRRAVLTGWDLVTRLRGSAVRGDRYRPRRWTLAAVGSRRRAGGRAVASLVSDHERRTRGLPPCRAARWPTMAHREPLPDGRLPRWAPPKRAGQLAGRGPDPATR